MIIYVRLALVALGILGAYEMCAPGDPVLTIAGTLVVFPSVFLYLFVEWFWPTVPNHQLIESPDRERISK